MHPELDQLDQQILTILLADARTAFTDIAKRLIVSAGTIHVRVKRMETLGIIKGSTLRIDASKLGYDLAAFIGIYLEKGSYYEDVVTALEQIPEVTEAHYTTGSYSIFAKILCKNTNHMRTILNDKIQHIPGISRTESVISLAQSFGREVPVDSTPH